MSRLRVLAVSTCVCIGVAIAGSVAVAQPSPDAPADADRPWAKGVTPANQKAALALFVTGNQMLKDSLFVKAVELYQEALSKWDHPAIHYNLALAMLNLNKPLEVYQALEKAMSYGPSPIDQDKYDHATRYKKVMLDQLSRVKLRTYVKGAKIVMDGKQLFVGPGNYDGLVLAGEHNIRATAPGYEDTNVTLNFPAGKTTNYAVPIFTASQLTRYKRKWKPWIPWSIVGGGALVLGVGALIHLSAKSDFEEFDKRVGSSPTGVEFDSSLSDLRSGAETKQSIAIVNYAIGGAILAAGVTLAYMNRSRSYRINPKELKKNKVSVTPVVSPNGGGLIASIRF